MAFASGRCFSAITISSAVFLLTTYRGQVQAESWLNFQRFENHPGRQHGQKFQVNGYTRYQREQSESSNHFNQPPPTRYAEYSNRFKYKSTPNVINPNNHRYRATASRPPHKNRHPNSDQQLEITNCNCDLLEQNKKEQPNFWPSLIQDHVKHNRKQLPKMFYLEKYQNINQDRRPITFVNGEGDSHGWLQTERITDQPASSNGAQETSIHGREDDKTYRLPGPSPKQPLFRSPNPVTQERQRPKHPNVQVHYDTENHNQRSRMIQQLRERNLTFAISNFVRQYLAHEDTDKNPFSRWSNEAKELPVDVEVFIRFVDRRKRQVPSSQ